MPKPRTRRIRPIEAWQALRALLAAPDDTSQVFRLLRATSGNSFGRLYKRVLRDPVGARIVAEAPPLLDVLNDRALLRSLPEGTLGAEYLAFVEAEKISADGLVEASEAPDADRENFGWDPEAVRFGNRLRDMHDLWHVVTGYDRDLLGEIALLAFTFQQTREPGIWLIVWAARRRIRQGGMSEIDAFVATAARRGRTAAFLPAADWEALLACPLDAVRRELEIDAPVVYTQRRSQAGERASETAALRSDVI